MTWTSTGTSFWEANATVTGTSPPPPPFLPPLPPGPPPPGTPEEDAPPLEQPYKNRSDTPITHRFRSTCRNPLGPSHAWAKCIDINRSCTLELAVNHILMLPRSSHNGPSDAHILELFQKLGRRRYLLRVRRLAASVIVGEDVPHGALGELYLFTVPPTDPEGDGLQMRPEMPPSWVGVRSTDPDVLVIIADRHGLAGRGPGCPCGVGRRQVVLRFVLPVQNRNPLIADQDLVVRREAVIIVARSEEAIRAENLGTIEQLCLNLLAAGRRCERDRRGQRGGHANRRPDHGADVGIRPHCPIVPCCRAPRQRRRPTASRRAAPPGGNSETAAPGTGGRYLEALESVLLEKSAAFP